MKESNRTRLAEEDPTLLFEEYLSTLDAGASADPDEFVRRAGTRGDELRRRLRVYAALQELSDTLQPELGGESEAQRDAARGDESLQTLGRFRDLSQIGHGGSSRVLLAYDPKLARRVALKVFSPRELGVRDARAWMRNEGRSLARLEHAGVVRVFDVDEADGHAYIEMEYVRGPSLRDVLDRMRSQRSAPRAGATDRASAIDRASASDRARASDRDSAAGGARASAADPHRSETAGAPRAALPTDAWAQASSAALASLPARVRLASKLARALQYCHAQGVIHRDIKPGNILLVDEASPKLIDFGLAHSESDDEALHQVTQRLVGTPAYLAPEQVDKIRTGASPASDQFALGSVLYELLTLESPFQKETRDETLRAISRADPTPPRKLEPAIPSDLELVVRHCLERQAKDRYPSVGAVADDLDAFLELRAISLAAPSPLKVLRLWIARHRRDVAVGGALLAAVTALLVSWWLLSGRTQRKELRATLATELVRVNELSMPQEFEIEYLRLHQLETDARELDGENRAAVLGGGLEAKAHAAIDACSRRLAGVLSEQWQTYSEADAYQKREGARRIMSCWGTVLGMDLSYCPDCRHNERDRQRGRVDLPAAAPGQALRVMAYEPLHGPMLSSLKDVDFRRGLMPGLYRCQLLDAAGSLLREADFESCVTEERHALELRPLHPEIGGRMSRFEVSTLPFLGSTLDVGPFSIMESPMRWRDLGLIREPSQVSLLKANAENLFQSTFADSDPAIVDYQEAQAIAVALGARVPKLEELLVAWRDEKFVPLGVEAIAAGELATGLAAGGQRTLAPYAVRAWKPGAAPPRIPAESEFESLSRVPAPGGKWLGYTFRLAFGGRP